MNIRSELVAIVESMFDGNLLDKVLETYKKDRKDIIIDITEKEYDDATQALAAAMNKEQKTALAKMENLCRENVRYSLRFGFTSGVFAGFQQFFVEPATQQPFEVFVADQILIEPNMRKYQNYYERRCEFNDINAALETQLDADNKEHLVSIYSAWEDRLCGVLRHSFYMGYRYAISVIDDVNPHHVINMTEKMLMTEYELGYISPLSTWEQKTIRNTVMKEKKTQQ